MEREGERGKKQKIRTYRGSNGRELAAIDALDLGKTAVAKVLARKISQHANPNLRFPTKVGALFDFMSIRHHVDKKNQQ